MATNEFKLEVQSGNAACGLKSLIFVLSDIEIWHMALENDRAPPLCNFNFSASFHIHQWIHTWVTVRKRQIWVKISEVFEPRDPEIWQMTSKNNRTIH